MEETPQFAPKVVIIIGNGFDLDLGLKTRYSDFIQSDYFKPLIKKVCFPNSVTDFDDFKSEMQVYPNSLAKFVHKRSKGKNWQGLENDINDYCHRKESQANEKNNKKELLALKYALLKYLQIEVGSKYNVPAFCECAGYYLLERLKHHNADFNVWNFNYTNTCHSILEYLGFSKETAKETINHPHNSILQSIANHSIDIILGTRYDAKVMQVCQSAIKANQSNDGYSQMVNSLRNHLEQAETLIIFGFSMGQSDSQYFDDFLKSPNKLKNILVIDYDSTALENVRLCVDKLSRGKIMRRIEKGTFAYIEFGTKDFTKNDARKEKLFELIENVATYNCNFNDLDI